MRVADEAGSGLEQLQTTRGHHRVDDVFPDRVARAAVYQRTAVLLQHLHLGARVQPLPIVRRELLAVPDRRPGGLWMEVLHVDAAEGGEVVIADNTDGR